MIKTMVLARTLRFSPLLKNTITKSRQGHSEPSRLRLRRKRGKETQSRPEDEPFIFHPLVRTIQPVSQALRITKTIINEQLPPVITSASKDLPLKEILDQIKQSILPADYFDCPEKSKYDQRSKGLITNVVKAIWSAAESHPGLLNQTLSYRPDLKVYWRRFGYNFQVSGRTGVLFSSSYPLPNFASESEVNNTVEIPVHNKEEIISPTFELSQNSSKPVFDSGFFEDVFPFPHTLIITESNWKLPHLIAQGMMFSFGRLVERAVSLNKASFGESLEYPLCIRSLVYNRDRMALLCYQLNTLDFESDEGVKNQLWLMSEIPMYVENRTKTEHSLDEAKKSGIRQFPEDCFKTLVRLFLYGEDDESIPKVVREV